MTPAATRFIPVLTLSTLSGRQALIDIFPEASASSSSAASWTKHIELGRWADLFVIAPASAQSMAKLAHGFCDNMLTAVALAARCPLLICPAMDHDMYVHPATRENLRILQSLGYEIMPPEHGELASGLIGTGRLPDPEAILNRIITSLASSETGPASQSLRDKNVLVTAGPTRESLDPVRFLTNHSTGTMGFELAAAAQRRGARVTLVSGPTALETPDAVTRIDVVSAAEMEAAVARHADADLIIMAAAVADYTPAQTAPGKIKKSGGDLNLTLKRTTDILAGLGEQKREGQTLVGFALETDDLRDNALRKLRSKNLDWIVLNSPTEAGAGFGTSTNKVTLFAADGTERTLPLMPKREVAEAILDQVEASAKS